MAEGIPAGLSAANGRKFGLTVGLAFAAIGGVLLWRGKTTASYVLFAIGGLLIAAGLVIPTSLGPVERAWMGLAHLISKVTTPIFMGVVYFLIITPAGFLRNLRGTSPIKPRVREASGWKSHRATGDQRERLEHQF